RQSYAATTMLTVKRLPVGAYPCQPQPSYAFHEHSFVDRRFVGVTHGGDERVLLLVCRVPLGQGGQSMAGADLEKNTVRIGKELLQAFGELHGLAQVRGVI